MQVLNNQKHIRVKPISVKRPITVPPGRPRPIPSNKIIQTRPTIKVSPIKAVRPKPVLPKIQHRLITKQRTVAKQPPKPSIPQLKSFLNINQFKGIGKGKILIIIANGPSHKLTPLNKLKGISGLEIMCINKPDNRVWPPDYWTFCDNSQYHRHIDLWNNFTGTIFNTPSVVANKQNVCKVRHIGKKQFSLDLNSGLHIGNSSTFAAMQIANWMNYDKVYVFGLDMGAVDNKLYAWGSNPDVSDKVREKRFATEAISYQWAADNLTPEIRSRFIICSEYNKWPFMRAFKSLPCRDAVEHIIGIMAERNGIINTEVKNETQEIIDEECKQETDGTSIQPQIDDPTVEGRECVLPNESEQQIHDSQTG